ncbi:unnamed protein product, partial [Heterotrigona itama]
GRGARDSRGKLAQLRPVEFPVHCTTDCDTWMDICLN